MPADTRELEEKGRVWVRAALGRDDLIALDCACRTENAPGTRLGWNDGLSKVVGGTSRLDLLAQRLLPGAVPVRTVAFNKSSDVNWSVPWHQDRVIAVREKHPVDGFDAWTNKAGTWHVEPPIDVLRQMIFACVHLDDTDERNGCLELALGTHAQGHVRREDASEIADTAPQELCYARRGDVLFVKALTVHRSRPSQQEGSRRTLRIDFCAADLPKPLAWAF